MKEGEVVQAQVVQAQVVGQPVVQQPVQYGGMPVVGVSHEQMDQQASQFGWMMYLGGCFLCWCCGGVGFFLWAAVACMHFCKPADQRARLPQERTVACCSLWTAVLSLIATIAIIVAMTAWVWAAASELQDAIECGCTNVSPWSALVTYEQETFAGYYCQDRIADTCIQYNGPGTCDSSSRICTFGY
eukprot:TRINITY_DN92800_c0_g1_i1.p1 TRINITY_DN92800_c0_g1~~TRINITY_DN92800_c0_g1_i1.p1  ORF type:complete len:187 (+),score=27.16 TRINITY_DN92800_c0_g1_i1:126-686(+)